MLAVNLSGAHNGDSVFMLLDLYIARDVQTVLKAGVYAVHASDNDSSCFADKPSRQHILELTTVMRIIFIMNVFYTVSA